MEQKIIRSTNMPVMAINDMVDILADSYSKLIEGGIPLKTFPSVMLWGAPGVGKSQGVRQIAKKIQTATGKKTVVTDVRLLLFNPIDLRGIPVASEDRTLAIWLKPKIFQMDPSEDIVNILFLDEISAAPQSVQAAAYQITLDRVVGEHQLPENCIVIAAGNRVTDKSVSFKMPKALANRLLHIEIEGSLNSWRNWAVSAGVNPLVVGFLSFRPDLLFGFDPTNDDLAFATPRAWEMVSGILNHVSDEVEEVFDLICGLVGMGTAMEFKAWANSLGSLPSMEDVFGGAPVSVPKRVDQLYVLVSSMRSYARSCMYDIVKIQNSIVYAAKFPADFKELLISGYRSMEEDYEDFLREIPEYIQLLSKNSYLRNGYVGRKNR